jgi:hypothetical protein
MPNFICFRSAFVPERNSLLGCESGRVWSEEFCRRGPRWFGLHHFIPGFGFRGGSAGQVVRRKMHVLGVVRQRLEKNHNLMGRWRYCKIASHFITAIMAQLLVSQK